MKRYSIFIIVLFIFAISGCQNSRLEYENSFNDGTIKYVVALDRSAGTKAGVETSRTALTLSDKSGSLTIPMVEEVTEGINNPVTSALTKGTLVNTTGDDYKTLETFADIVGSFVTNAYDGSGNEKASQTVTWSQSSSAWVGSPVAYWPQGESLNFLAYANLPSGRTATIASTGVSTFHTVPASADAQTDILFGHYSGNGGDTGTAEIRFEHPLTAVRFLRGEMGEDLVIKSISIEGVAESGTAAMAPDGTISWDGVDSYDYTVSQEGDATSGLELSDLEGYSAQLIGEPFIIIPQKLADQNVEITITFTDGNEVAVILTSGEWKSGYTNTYIISADWAVVEVGVGDIVTGDVKERLVVANTGTSDAYLRVALVGFWLDADGNIVSGWDETQGAFTDFPGTEWVKGTDGYYYYTYPVKGSDGLPVETGTKLFSKYTAPEPPAEGLALEMDIIVQGVKYDKARTCVTEAWGSTAAGYLNDFINE